MFDLKAYEKQKVERSKLMTLQRVATAFNAGIKSTDRLDEDLNLQHIKSIIKE